MSFIWCIFGDGGWLSFSMPMLLYDLCMHLICLNVFRGTLMEITVSKGDTYDRGEDLFESGFYLLFRSVNDF